MQQAWVLLPGASSHYKCAKRSAFRSSGYNNFLLLTLAFAVGNAGHHPDADPQISISLIQQATCYVNATIQINYSRKFQPLANPLFAACKGAAKSTFYARHRTLNLSFTNNKQLLSTNFGKVKKIVAIFFLITYGFTNVGATVHMHYCMDKFVGANFWHSQDNKCGKCGMTEKNKNGCCKDEHKQIKIDKPQQKTTSDYNFSIAPSPEIFTAFTYYTFAETTITGSLPDANAPPPRQGVSIYIFNCTYRI